ncbi:hypothetical protein WY02_04025 [Pseudonocardia sp. AL041005-10]|nr:hypothetical protein WY02_04025 [Pseudonocardia sp. AL041005-10]
MPELGQHGGDDLIGAAAHGRDRHGGDLGVERGPLGEQRPERRPRVHPGQQRARGGHPGAAHPVGEVHLEGDDAVPGEQCAGLGGQHGAAAEGEDAVPGAQLLGDDLALQRTERGLALLDEHLRDRLADAGDDRGVGVGEVQADPLREQRADGALAGPGRADEHHPGAALGVGGRGGGRRGHRCPAR